MSIAVAVLKNGRISLATDSQTSFGSSRMPAENLKTTKTHDIGRAVMATTGWGLYENILDDYLSRYPNTELSNRRKIFDFFMGFWKELREHYTLVKEQCDKDDESPFGSLDASFLIVNENGIFHVGTDMSVTEFQRYYAIGSGGDFAMGALAAVYDTLEDSAAICERAVHAAIMYDVHCGGPIQMRTLEQAEES